MERGVAKFSTPNHMLHPFPNFYRKNEMHQILFRVWYAHWFKICYDFQKCSNINAFRATAYVTSVYHGIFECGTGICENTFCVMFLIKSCNDFTSNRIFLLRSSMEGCGLISLKWPERNHKKVIQELPQALLKV